MRLKTHARAAFLVAVTSISSARGEGLDFDGFTSLTVGKSAAGLVATDIDGDGSVDLVSPDREHSVLVMFHNTGTEFLPAKTSLRAGSWPQGLAGGDLDRDGDQDLLVSYGLSSVEVFWNDGRGIFSPERSLWFPYDARPFLAADLSGDGEEDMVLASSRDGRVVVVPNEGGGMFSEPVFIPVPVGITSLEASDFDGDGDVDLVYGSFEPERGAWLVHGGGDGTFAEPVKIHEGMGPFSLEAVDLNGDGWVEIVMAVVTEARANAIALWNIGLGRFREGPVLAVDPGPNLLAAGDFDGDRDDDLALTHVGESGRVSVIENVGGSRLTARQRFALGGGAAGIAAVDLDRDGKADLVVARSHDTGTIAISRSGPDGSFRVPEELRTGAADAQHTAAVVDLDGDGRLEVVAGTGSWFTRYHMTGEGRLERGEALDTGGSNVFLVTSDIGGDGDRDLITLDVFGGVAVKVLENDGDGRFAAPYRVPLFGYPAVLFVADLDGRDGEDLVVGTDRPQGLEMSANRGGGVFDETSKLGLQGTPTWITGGDLDVDGDMDLVVSTLRQNAQETLLLENPGDGGFSSAKLKFAGDLVAFLGDLDQDGDPDIVTSNSVIHENIGDGGLRSRQPLRPIPVGLFVTGDDFDGDGRLDLVFSHSDADEVAVYRNEGSAMFEPPVKFASAERPRFLATGDLDIDGFPDLLVQHDYRDLFLVFGFTQPSAFHRGDSNSDGRLDISDGVHVLDYLYFAGPEPACKDASDATDDAALDCSDAIFIFGYLFLGTPVPTAPGPPGSSCGPDTGADGLGCEAYAICE